MSEGFEKDQIGRIVLKCLENNPEMKEAAAITDPTDKLSIEMAMSPMNLLPVSILRHALDGLDASATYHCSNPEHVCSCAEFPGENCTCLSKKMFGCINTRRKIKSRPIAKIERSESGISIRVDDLNCPAFWLDVTFSFANQVWAVKGRHRHGYDLDCDSEYTDHFCNFIGICPMVQANRPKFYVIEKRNYNGIVKAIAIKDRSNLLFGCVVVLNK